MGGRHGQLYEQNGLWNVGKGMVGSKWAPRHGVEWSDIPLRLALDIMMTDLFTYMHTAVLSTHHKFELCPSEATPKCSRRYSDLAYSWVSTRTLIGLHVVVSEQRAGVVKPIPVLGLCGS
jgi:hypothetical protein